MRKQTIAISIVLVVSVVVVVFLALFFLGVLSPIFDQSKPDETDKDLIIRDGLHIALDGTTLTDETGRAAGILIRPGESKQFDITAESVLTYAVRIVVNSNATETFDFYTSSGQLKSFYMQNDMTKGFEIDKKVDHFTISVPKLGITEILSKVYSEPVEIVGPVTATNLFAAVVVFENGATLVLEFCIGVDTDGLILSDNEVVF